MFITESNKFRILNIAKDPSLTQMQAIIKIREVASCANSQAKRLYFEAINEKVTEYELQDVQEQIANCDNIDGIKEILQRMASKIYR